MRTVFQLTPSDIPIVELLTVTAFSARPDAVVITVRGEIDLFTGPRLRNRLHERIHRRGPDLVVDLTGVRFFGAAGLSVLVGVRARTLAAEVGLRVVADQRAVLLPLMIAGLDGMFDVHPDLARALERPVSARPVIPAQAQSLPAWPTKKRTG